MIALWMLLGCPIVTETDKDAIRDRDGDGFDAIDFGGLDCDDDDALVHPLAEEVWYDGIDDDCDGNDDDRDEDGVPGGVGPDCDDDDPDVDGSLFERYLDSDGDGFGAQAADVCPGLAGYVDVPGDCDDTDAGVSPAADEVWYDGIDDDCDGNDNDRDEDGSIGGPGGADCDDDDPTIQDSRVFSVDDDKDGFGSQFDTVVGGCLPDVGEADNSLDCNDEDPNIHPDAAEVCDPGANVDEDCDELIDDLDDQGPAPGNQSFFYVDSDGDGFGAGKGILQCSLTTGLSAVDGDCDDGDDEAFPGALRYLDRDGDGWGLVDNVVESCAVLAGRVLDPGDCDDRNSDVHPDPDEEEDDELFDFIDADCAGDTDVDTTPQGYPLPIGSWSVPPEDWQTVPTACGTPTIREVGPAAPYTTIQAALDVSLPCDIVAVHEGSYAPFTVRTRGVVVTAVPDDEVVIWAGGGIRVEAEDVLLAELQIQQATQAIAIVGSAFLDRLTLVDNLGNITASGDLLAYDLHITGGVGGLARGDEGSLRLVGASFEGVLGLLGVIQSWDLSISSESSVVLEDVAIVDSTGGFLGAVSVVAPTTEIDGLSVRSGAGPALEVSTRDATMERLDLRENVVFDRPLVSVHGTSASGGRAVVHDVTVVDNSWILRDSPADTAFVVLDDFHHTFIDKVHLAANAVDAIVAPIGTRPVWLRSISGSFFVPPTERTIHHVAVSGYDAYGSGDPTGVGIQAHGGSVRQATLVGLDAGLWSVERDGPAPELTDSIVWDVGQLYLDLDWGLLTGAEPSSFEDNASNHSDCTGCDRSDPLFLRYHPSLDGSLWDLRLFRESPYYQFGLGIPIEPTCAFDALSVIESPVDTQLGAFGNHGLDPADLSGADGRLPAIDLLGNPFVYNDCDEDDMYDSWEVVFRALNPLIDQDFDGVHNIDEFWNGTLPDDDDTDGDGTLDGVDTEPLDPTLP